MNGKRCDSEADGDDVIEGNDEKKISIKTASASHIIPYHKARQELQRLCECFCPFRW